MLARLGIKRNDWRVSPGVYRIGSPGPSSPVFASANYKLSFDALREGLAEMDAWILVIDTKGINVWCAAGKGNFGTEELVTRIRKTTLADVVETREIVVPQLAATGVCAREVKRQSGFKVIFGPVRAADIKEFMKTGEATEEMRRVEFPLKDRAVLIPVEADAAVPVMAVGAGLVWLSGDRKAAVGIVGATVAGLVGFPTLMPVIPGEDFSTRGFVLGGAVGAAAALSALFSRDGASISRRLLRAASYMLALPPVSAFIALNFTGASTIASPSAVKREMDRYIPVMAGMAGAGVMLNVAQRLLRSRKG